MKERIEKMIGVFRSDDYWPRPAHEEYDEILEQFILNYDESLLPLMKELISIEKELWYA